MSSAVTSNPGLVVPVDVVGFCVSEIDEQEATGAFAGATVVYTNQTGSQTPAYLGSNVSRGFDAPPWKRLEAGVHLHWALPDALTKARRIDENNTAVSFPAAPNRWLITRLTVNGSAVAATSWAIESDALSSAAPATGAAVTVPVQGEGGPDFAYLGRVSPLESYAPATGPGETRSFKAATGFELSAVSNGAPTFAAFYPESRSAFGFVDPLSDISGIANLTYVVTGWFDAGANDPASISENLAASHAWSTSDRPDYTLYSGFIQDIAWDPSRAYVQGQANQQPITAQAAVGNTPIEALSAYFRALNHPDVPLFEPLLNAFQEGLLARFATPQAGLLPKLAEALHDNQFQAVDAGLIYTVTRVDAQGDEQEATNLPLPLADALNALNVAAQSYQAVYNDTLSFRWRMFADWYRYFQSNADGSGVIFNHAGDLFAQFTTPDTGLQALLSSAQTTLGAQIQQVETMLADTSLSLKPTPAPRYWQPTDPAVLLASPDLSFPARYGGDTRFSPDGLLTCRPTNQLVSAVSVAGHGIEGSTYAAACTLGSTALPYAADCQNLLIEACLLNTQLGASVSGQTDAALSTALAALLAGETQSSWTIQTGAAPSPVAVAAWAGANPWMPLFLQWNVSFAPLLATTTGTALADYPTTFFTSNFTVDPAVGSFVSYTPGAGGISVDPAHLTFGQTWSGQSILSTTSADNLISAIQKDGADSQDQTLQTILAELLATPTLVQPLSGFTASLLMQQQIVQLQIAVPSNAPFTSTTLTDYTVEVVGPAYHVSPQTGWFFNPVRAGWFKVSLQAIDVFGQKRAITLTSIAEAASMTATSGGQPVDGVAYAAPRLAQPARLLFQWISAAADGLVEMNSHPATTPICGWLLPNHLDGGFFLYDAAGKPLGSLGLNGDQTRIVWQSAPGDDATIDLPIDQALADVNPIFSALAMDLANAAPAWFLDFWTSVDQVHGGISPDQLATNAGLSVLIGRPVAVAQTALRLDLQGRPALNQSWACLSSDNWTDTDNGASQVQFPVVLGDIDKLDDGLIGYFKVGNGGYDFSTFYTQGADLAARTGVIQPVQDTLLLTPSPQLDDPEPPTPGGETLQLLVLVDPRAKIHATMGVLPTQSLQIPPDLAADALSILEMSFPVTPILSPATRLALPVPREAGYAISFVEEIQQDGAAAWRTIPDISSPTINAVWDYTPQSLSEGWLRLNPTVLAFDLLNAAGKALVAAGAVQAMTLRVTNNKPAAITFMPGVIAPEGTPPKGSIVYLHFGALVGQADVGSMTLTAADWTFQSMSDATYGHYWAATPTAAIQLPAGHILDIAVTGLKASATGVQAQIYADYYAIDGVADGVFADLVTIQQPSA